MAPLGGFNVSWGDQIKTKLNYQTLCRPSGEIVSGGSAGLSLPPEAFFGIEIARKVEVGGGGVQSGALRDLRAERRAPCSVELTSYPPLSGQWWNIANNCNQLAHRPFLSATILIHCKALSSSFCLWRKGNLWGKSIMRVRKAFTCSGTSEGLSYFICCASFLLVLYSIRLNLFTFTSPSLWMWPCCRFSRGSGWLVEVVRGRTC